MPRALKDLSMSPRDAPQNMPFSCQVAKIAALDLAVCCCYDEIVLQLTPCKCLSCESLKNHRLAVSFCLAAVLKLLQSTSANELVQCLVTPVNQEAMALGSNLG